ncbi:nitroreductase family deazaflavin-dependent oxidoreductase [Streptomyces arboris]|uniref:Nitroreductase family deazaflavin-dependent oxidoreductase n=2 Tax=Streptomyces arboris TaxID=2600619 RepID=A0A5N5EJC8_9ACTN|nr:nitroreductase family deazaflavin-dependent oxidoreductase [Streptomyces arboris]KAB2588692.1 nitroreductase family deazaflavin-dependent oxidoreductase [Streptomyces arboris]
MAMMQKHGEPDRPRLPRGWRRRLARLPIAFYRAGLGPALGRRLLLLRHTGRHSGLDQFVVLEVVAHDPERGTWTLASGFGPDAAWYRNLQAAPKTTIQVGNRHYAVTAHFPSAEEGSELMARYARSHPRAARRLCAFMGARVPNGSPHSYRQVGLRIPFVRLEAALGQHLP